MKVVAFVPIKLDNERFPNKNTVSFTNGKPLLTYILNTLLKVKEIDESYVFCSDDLIQDYLPQGIRYLKRPKSLDTKSTSGNDLLSAFMNIVDADVYVMTHATVPFTREETIKLGIDMVVSGKYDSSLTVFKMQDFLWIDNNPINYNPANIPRTQDLTPIFVETNGLYVVKKSVIVNENRRVGHNPYFIEVSRIEGIDIDEEEDFILADAIYNYYLSKS